MHRRYSALLTLALLAAPNVARADTPHTHDGFYLRIGLGLGYLSDSETLKVGSLSIDSTIKGGGASGEFLLGGTVRPGLVVGGGFQGGTFSKPTVKSGGVETGSSFTFQASSLGAFVDYYPNPAQGLHFQGYLGLARLSFSSDDGRKSTDDPTGLALSGGVGHEWYVSSDWSIGVLGRLQFIRARYSDALYEVRDSVLIPAVLATFTYH